MYGNRESDWDPRGHHGGHGGHGGGRRGPGGPGWAEWAGGPRPTRRTVGWPRPPGPTPMAARHRAPVRRAGPRRRVRGPAPRPRARRGDVRAAILDVLAGDEMNGYQLIQQISERSDGAWKPSPGSVYPTVQQLEDEGLVEGREVEGRRLLRLTDAGRAYVEEHPDEMAATWAPFEAADDEANSRWSTSSGPGHDLMPVMSQVMGAMWQIITTGTAQQRAEATEILTKTRRQLYNLLAEGDAGEGEDRADG